MKRAVLLLSLLLLVGCSNQATTNEKTDSSTVTSEQAQQATITLNITADGKAIEGSPFTFAVDKDASLLDVMKEHLTIEENNGFITSINGVKQDEAANKWWLFDYNGTMSEVGAAEVKLQDGDTIDWKLESLE